MRKCVFNCVSVERIVGIHVMMELGGTVVTLVVLQVSQDEVMVFLTRAQTWECCESPCGADTGPTVMTAIKPICSVLVERPVHRPFSFKVFFNFLSRSHGALIINGS